MMRDPLIDGVLEDYFAEQRLALVVLSSALPASLYFPGEEGHMFNGDDDSRPAPDRVRGKGKKSGPKRLRE